MGAAPEFNLCHLPAFDICQKKVNSCENSIESISDFCVQHAKILLLVVRVGARARKREEEGKMNLKYRAAIQLVSIPIVLVRASRVCVYCNIEINIFLC